MRLDGTVYAEVDLMAGVERSASMYAFDLGNAGSRNVERVGHHDLRVVGATGIGGVGRMVAGRQSFVINDLRDR
ncbi:MAG: hypothetical protein GKS06_10600 [Acidobacteria bacterium]|nr:hypothetical protein [Acidobacteriota bacterium]